MPVAIERLAAHHLRQGFGKTYVALGTDDLAVTGFVTLSAGQVESPRLPASVKLPRYPASILRMGRLAVDHRAQGQGTGWQLLSFALQLALEFSRSVGLYAVVDAKHGKARLYYQTMGFTPTLDDPLRLYLPVSVLEKAKPTASRQEPGFLDVSQAGNSRDHADHR